MSPSVPTSGPHTPVYNDYGSSLPEVVNPKQYPAYSDGPQVVHSDTGPQNAPEVHYQHGQYPQYYDPYDQSPEVAWKQDDHKGAAGIAGVVPMDPAVGSDPNISGNLTPPIPFWRKKRMMLLAGIVVLLVAVGAVVGGVLGSEKPNPSPPLSSGILNAPSTQTASPPTPTSPTTSSASPTPPARRLGSAASTSRTDDVFSQGIQLFWQTNTSSDITYSVYNNGADYGPLRSLSLSLPPKGPTPLAATSWWEGKNKTNDAIVQLYYLLETDDTGRVDIALADIICDHNQTCRETATTIISTNVTAKIAPNSDLSAVWRRDQDNFVYNVRIYYQAEATGSIIELSGDQSDTEGWHEKDLTLPAQNGTSITAVFAPGTSMELYYIAPDGAISVLVNTDHWEPGDAIDKSPSKGAGGNGVLQGCWENASGIFRVYYVTDTGSILEYGREGGSGSWAPGMSPNGQTADETMAIACWDKEVRLYYLEDNVFERATRKQTSWQINAVKDA